MEKKIKILSFGLIINIMMAYTNISFGVTQNELKNEKENVNASISAAQDELNEIKEEKTETMSQVEKLFTQISDYQEEIDSLENKIENLEDKIQNAQEQIKADEKEYDEKKNALNERLVAIYENGDISYLDVLLSSNNLTDFISSYYMVSELTSYDSEIIRQIEEEKEKIENEKVTLENDRKELEDVKKSKETKATSLKMVKKEKENKIEQLSNDEQEKAKEINELKEHENAINAKIIKMQKEYDEQLRRKKEEEEAAAAAAKKNNTSNSKNISSSSSSNSSSNDSTSSSSNSKNTDTSTYGFGWPVSNANITTKYGVSGKYWSSGHHTGIDFKASVGTSVYSIGDGKVFDTGYNSAYGNYVEIYHGNNIYSFYAHASSVKVSLGQSVSKGQLIMLSGATGNVTGPHLHFEIRSPGYKYANCVDPMKYLP